MNDKIKSLREKMSELELDGMIIENPINIRYITGIQAEGTLILNDKENLFITDARYIEDLNNTITLDDEIVILNVNTLEKEDYFRVFANCCKVGVEENYITYAEYTNIVRKYRIKETVETDSLIEKMREIKTQNEIACIEKACNITDSCFLHILDFIKPGISEKDVAIEIQKFIIESGADGLAFETIVASGENSSKPHVIPTNRIIQSGDAIILDFGAKYNGYCADMTRTIFVDKVTETEKELYEFLLNVQIRAFNKYKNNANCNEIACSVQNELYAHNFDLIHALGHGVGMEIHEKPILSTKSNYTLREDMIVTNEPGIYIPGKLGIRIEDTVLVNNMSATNLTKSNKNLLVIENY